MTKSLIIPALAGAALLLVQSATAQAQTRHVQPKTQLPSTGSAFAIKNGGAFTNQGGIAGMAGPGRGAGLVGMDHATKPGILSRDGAGFTGGAFRR